MTQNIEAALELQNAKSIEYRPKNEDMAIPVIASQRAKSEAVIGTEFETDHPDYGECTVEVTDRYHSEKKIRRLIKEEITLADWMRAKLWRLKRRLL